MTIKDLINMLLDHEMHSQARFVLVDAEGKEQKLFINDIQRSREGYITEIVFMEDPPRRPGGRA